MKSADNHEVQTPAWALTDHSDPLPLSRELDPPTPYPVDALGPLGAGVVQKMHEVIQAPMALIGQSILAAMNQVSQPHANVIIDGRVSPLSDYFLTLGESGERKSAADAWALQGVRHHQRTLMQQFDIDRDSYELAAQVYDAAAKRILADKKLSTTAKQAKLDEMDKPVSPVMPLFIVSEPSTEAIQRQLIIGLPSIGLVNDEGGQFLGGYAMSAEKRLGTLTTLSRLWDRGEFDRVRVGDGSGSYYGRRLSLHLMVQPTVAAMLLADPLAREQGFLARCLISYPKSTAGNRKYVEADLSSNLEYQAYAERVNELLVQEWPLVNDHELNPPNIVLTPTAKRVWIALYNDIEAALGGSGPLAPIRSLASKAPEHITRMAGTFAVFEGDTNIHEHHIDRAALLMKHYLAEAMRLWGAGQVSVELKLAQEVLNWLRDKMGPGRAIPLADIYRNGPSAIRNAGAARRVMQVLKLHGWVDVAEHKTAREAYQLVAV
jgi:hypothetical protein